MDIIENIFKKYSLDNHDKEYLYSIILPIYNHPEFQKRMANNYFHHSSISLGEHLIEDATVTYILSKKYALKNNYDIELAVKIALLHDLYAIPWQNNQLSKVDHFFNKHGFRHPIEACINAYSWYPNLFVNENDSVKIIDGIIHHMYPLPVRVFRGNMELKNIELVDSIPDNIKKIMINSTKRKRIGSISLSKSKYKEGRIMSKADKKVSRRQIKNYECFKALFTGKNKSIDKGT